MTEPLKISRAKPFAVAPVFTGLLNGGGNIASTRARNLSSGPLVESEDLKLKDWEHYIANRAELRKKADRSTQGYADGLFLSDQEVASKLLEIKNDGTQDSNKDFLRLSLLRNDILDVEKFYDSASPHALRHDIPSFVPEDEIVDYLLHYDYKLIEEVHGGNVGDFIRSRTLHWYQNPPTHRFDLLLPPMITSGNQVDFYVDYEYHKAIAAAIDRAIDLQKLGKGQQHLHFAQHEMLDGIYTRALLAHLTRAAKAGVEVRLILCAVGSHIMGDAKETASGSFFKNTAWWVKKFLPESASELFSAATAGGPNFEELRAAGGEVRVFSPAEGSALGSWGEFASSIAKKIITLGGNKDDILGWKGILHLKIFEGSDQDGGEAMIGGGTLCDETAYSKKVLAEILEKGSAYPTDKNYYPIVPKGDHPMTHDHLMSIKGPGKNAISSIFHAMWAYSGGKLKPTVDASIVNQYLPIQKPLGDSEAEVLFGLPGCTPSPLNRRVYEFLAEDPKVPLDISNYMAFNPSLWETLKKREGATRLLVPGVFPRLVDKSMAVGARYLAKTYDPSTSKINIGEGDSFVHGKSAFRRPSLTNSLLRNQGEREFLVVTSNFDNLSGGAEKSLFLFDAGAIVRVPANSKSWQKVTLNHDEQWNRARILKAADLAAMSKEEIAEGKSVLDSCETAEVNLNRWLKPISY